MKHIIFVLIFLFNQVAFAACPESIQEIQKGQVANCTGLLFSPEASKDVDEKIQDAEYYRKLTEQLYKRRDLSIEETNVLDKRLKLYMDQSHILAKEVHRKEKEDKWQKVIWFGLGIIATGAAVYGAGKLIR